MSGAVILPLKRAMKFYTYKPPSPLSRYIEVFWYCEDYLLEHRWERIVPTPQAQLLVNLGEDELRWRTPDGRRHRASGAGFSAESFQAVDIDTRQQVHIMGALFSPGGASVLSPHPAEVTLNQHLDLSDFLPDQLFLRERLLEESTVLPRFLLLQNLLSERLATQGYRGGSGREDRPRRVNLWTRDGHVGVRFRRRL